MNSDPKPRVTGMTHVLPFFALSPEAFERLTLWLVRREGFENVQHLGEAGSEQGRDIEAWKEGKRFAFQCKRVKAFSALDGEAEIRKLRGLESAEQPQEVVFVVPIALRAATRKAIWKAWGDEATCNFWVGNELDERVKCYPDLVREFFQISVEPPKRSFLHNLPYPSLGPLFQGRHDWLTRLHQSLADRPSGRATAIAGKAMHGLGGVGKTRLAVEYAWRYAGEYRAAFFVGAEAPAILRRNLAALSGPPLLNLPEHAATEEEIREAAVLRWLEENAGWLLILDNVDTEEAAKIVDGLLAKLHGGHVLLTGRITRWGAEVEAFPLDLLAPEAAVAFLLARTKGRRRSAADDEIHVAEIARELGYLPLALEQASAYIAERRLTFAGYMEEWRTRRERVLGWFDARLSHYPASVAVTWQTSVDRLSAPARRLLERLAWLAPEAIPESLLEVPVGGQSEEEFGPSPFDLFLELETYSLVTRAAEAPAFAVHRLVQDVTRRGLKGDQANEALFAALEWVNGAFMGDPTDVRTWPTLEPLTPHARAVVDFGEEIGISHPTSRLMFALALLFNAKALLAEAEPLMRRALAIDEMTCGSEHSQVASDLNFLATILHAMNRMTEAESLMRRALAIDETGFGAEHPRVAVHLNNLAQLLKATNRLAEAEPLMRRALAIDEESLGPEHSDIARDLNNLALLLTATNRLSEAEPLMRRALAMDEANFGLEHPKAAILLGNLAQLLQDTNRLAEAATLMRRALAINERSYGDDHPNVATELNNLAVLLNVTNRSAEAEPLMRRALAINEKSFGAEHPNVAKVLNNLAILLSGLNRFGEAEPLKRRALAIDEASLGADHPSVAVDLHNLALLLKSTDRKAEAEPIMRRSLQILLAFARSTGHEHPYLSDVRLHYYSLLVSLGRTATEATIELFPAE